MGDMYDEHFPVLSYTGFVNIMSSEKNEGYDPAKLIFSPRELLLPLDQYYIAASDGKLDESHSSDSFDSIVHPNKLGKHNGFVIAVQQGCRCLEMRLFEEDDEEGKSELYVGNEMLGTKRRHIFKGK